MPFDLTFAVQLVEVLGGFVLAVGAVQLAIQIRRWRRDKASRVSIWAAIPHNRGQFDGLRGVVIDNQSGTTLKNVLVEVVSPARDGAPEVAVARDVYPTVATGKYFLTLLDHDENGGVTPEGTGYYVLPATAADGGHLQLGLQSDADGSPDPFELVPWHITGDAREVGECKTYGFDLAGSRWRWTKRGLARERRWRWWKPKVVASDDIARSFPRASVPPAIEETASSDYDRVAALVGQLGEHLTGTVIEPGEERPLAEDFARRLRLAAIKRTSTKRTPQGTRGGVALRFLDSDGGETYYFAASNEGMVPAVFEIVGTAGKRSLMGEFGAQRIASAWNPSELAEAVVAAIEKRRAAKS